MIKNYLLTTLRNFRRNLMFSAINILGLTVGLTFCFLIALFVLDEYSYEAHNPNARDTYRLNFRQFRNDNTSRIVALTSWQGGELVQDAIPELEEMIRIRPTGGILIKTGETSVKVSQSVLAQENVFSFFQIPLIKGEPDQVLKDPTSIVLTEETAKALFGDEDPIGQIVTLKASFELPLKVTGIAKRLKNSHLNYDVFVSLNATNNQVNYFEWYQYSLYTYLRVSPQTDPEDLSNKINSVFESANPDNKIAAHLQSLDNIYLTSSNVEFAGAFKSGNSQNIKILVAAAIFILLIACVNYVNTNTSKATKRAREVGVRKTMGASLGQLTTQFLGESFLIAFIAVSLALLATDVSIPFFNSLVGKEIFFPLNDARIWVGLLVVFLLVSLGSGFYPAILMSRFKPSETLKGKSGSAISGRSARKFLIAFQFAVTIILLSGTYIIYNQTKYTIEKDLGFNKDEVMVISIGESQPVTNNPTPFQNELAQIPGVVLTSRGMDALGPGFTNNSGGVEPEGSLEPVLTTIFNADMNFLRTYGIEIVEGRDFNPDLASDSSVVIVNEEFVRQAGWDNPIGKKVADLPSYATAFRGREEGVPVIGVAKDFNFQNLRNKVNPALIMINKFGFWNLAVRVSTDNFSETIDAMNKAWVKFEPEVPFEYYFLNERFARYYQSDVKLLNVVGLFAILSIIVTCLGLYGLTSFVVEMKIKEIGIRKVLGASSTSVTWLINRQFGILLVFGFVAGVPITIWLGKLWLSDFAYKINIQWWIFAAAIMATAAIAALTITAKAISAALMNPVDTLRHE